MPLFSEHISNMYYSGTPSYISSPYSYGSSFTPLGTSYSASYLNPGASYSNHSSLGGYARTPLTTRWIPSSRSYSPMLSTISERGTSSPVRVNSPRRAPIQSRSNRTYVSAPYTPRPLNINTADIDVSRNKYRDKIPPVTDLSSQSRKENSNVEKDKCPLMSRVEDKPETGIDTSPGVKRGTIKRDRTVVRLHTLKRKERDSPRKPVEELQNKSGNVKEQKDKEESVETKRWREKLSDDLIYKDTREKKTLGAKLIEKFQVKDKDSDIIDNIKTGLKRQPNLVKIPSMEHNTIISNKSPDRRCSMELLAEQACLLDSLIRKENLSTATLDLSKIGTNESEPSHKNDAEQSSNSFTAPESANPLTTTKSDHSLHHRLNKLKDQKHTSKRLSVKKSASGGNISKLNSITEFPSELNQKDLPAIDESRQSLKDIEQKPKLKPILKTKITSTVEVTPPSSPLRFKVENITVDEKPRLPKKEIMFSSEVENVKAQNKDTTSKNKISTQTTDPVSPEPEDGNFWNKIGKRETVYLITRKQKLAKAKEDQQRTLFWHPEEECAYSENAYESKENIKENLKNNQSEDQNFRTKINEIQVDNKLEKAEQVLEKVTNTKSKTETENVYVVNSEIVSSPLGSQQINEIKTLPMESKLELKDVDQEFPAKMQTVDEDSCSINKKSKEKNIINDNMNSTSSRSSITKEVKVSEEVLTGGQIVRNSECNDKILFNNSSLNEVKTISTSYPKDNAQFKETSRDSKAKKLKKSSQKTKDEKHNQLINNEKKNENKAAMTDLIGDQNQILNEHSDIEPKLNVNNIPVKNEGNNLIVEEKTLRKISGEENRGEIKKSSLQLVNSSRKSIKNKQEDTINLSNEKEAESLCDTIKSNQEQYDVSRTPLEHQNIPNNIEGRKSHEADTKEIICMPDAAQENEKQRIEEASIKQIINPKPFKPVKEEKALKPLIATPRPLQKKVPQPIRSSSSSGTTSDDETSDEDQDEEESSSSESSAEFFECDNPDGRTSTGSNDSGFDSSASTSPTGFNCVRKDCDVNCHRKCEKLTANLCGVNQRLLVEALASRTASRREQSTAYGLFRKTGRFTPPARSIPRFRKYTIEDFQFIKVLGKGSFGKVLLAELRDTEYYYAVKCLKKDVVLEDDDVECTLIERKVLALGTNHPYLCHLFATFQTDSHLFFVMEYLNGGDLMFHIQQSGRFPEPRARFYGAEIVSGLKFLHKRGIIYRDLKLDNILLDFDGHVRIADFGMCKLQIYLDKTADTFCGTPDYMAPEIIKGLKYNQTVDWWSFGVLLYEMLIGQSPFSGCDEDELFWSICNEMPSYPRFLSQEALSILTRLLDKDARTRLGGAECMHGDVRDQDFFHAVAWDRLERRELEAPFKPRVRHPLDTQYFDRAFTGERPRLTAVEPQVLRSMDQEPFRGFSYTNPNATDR